MYYLLRSAMCAAHSRGTQTYCLIRTVRSPRGRQRQQRFCTAASTKVEVAVSEPDRAASSERPEPSVPGTLPEPGAIGSRPYERRANATVPVEKRSHNGAKKLSRRCDVLGCPNSRAESQDGSSIAVGEVLYHRVPPDEPRRTAWLGAVPLRKAKGRISLYAQVCSLHFRPGDYVTNASLCQSFGITWKLRKLCRDAVPSIVPAVGSDEQQPSLQQDHSSSDVASSAFQDSASSVQDNIGTVKDKAGLCVASLEMSVGPTTTVQSFGTQTEVDVPNGTAVQTSILSIGRDVAVQVCLRGRSTGVQVNLMLKDTS